MRPGSDKLSGAPGNEHARPSEGAERPALRSELRRVSITDADRAARLAEILRRLLQSPPTR